MSSSGLTWPSDLYPEFSWVRTPTWRTHETPMESGHVQTRAAWGRPLRTFSHRWNHTEADIATKLESFHHAVRGAAETFEYPVTDKKAPPYGPPELGQVAGGALGSRTRYVKYTWSAGGLETLASYEYDDLAISSGYLLTVTVPIFPHNVTTVWVYVGPSAGTYYKQSIGIGTSGGTWTEPVGGYSTGGAAPPSSNTFSETATVKFTKDGLSISKNHANDYSMDVTLVEVRS